MRVLAMLLLAFLVMWPENELLSAADPPADPNANKDQIESPPTWPSSCGQNVEGGSPAGDTGPACSPATSCRGARWPEVWGSLACRGFVDGERMAPNGHAYDPLFALDLDLN